MYLKLSLFRSIRFSTQIYINLFAFNQVFKIKYNHVQVSVLISTKLFNYCHVTFNKVGIFKETVVKSYLKIQVIKFTVMLIPRLEYLNLRYYRYPLQVFQVVGYL